MRIYFSILFLASCFLAKGEYVYRDFLTGFQDISQYCSADGYIRMDNQSDSTLFECQEYDIRNRQFKYTVWMNDGEEPSTKNRFLQTSCPTASFGLVWNFVDDKNYYAASFSRIVENNYDEIARNQYFKLVIKKISNGKCSVLSEKEIKSGVTPDPYEYNAFRIEYDGQTLSVSVGNVTLGTVFSSKMELPDTSQIGYFAGEGCSLKVKRICYEDSPIPQLLFATNYSKEWLDKKMAESSDPIEGYWIYLDRSTDDRFFELGGKYTIAIIKEDAGYNVLYVDGAELYSGYWIPYMSKGRLSETPFVGHFDLEWHDAMKNIIDDETYAVLSDFVLTFHFPIQKSQVRFRKLNPSYDSLSGDDATH